MDSDGTVTATVAIDDGDGAALDREGVFTQGAVSIFFVLSWLDEDESGPLTHTAYTTRTVMAPDGTTTEQAATDSGGTFTRLEDGVYRYSFGTRADTSGRENRTHTVAAYATREVDGAEAVDNEVFHWVPAGGDPTIRQVVQQDACNACHQDLSFHGGSRKDVDLCITCHSPQTTDPDSGNTTDFTIMIHKIHMGAQLPTVQRGEPYFFVGFRGRIVDYSDVALPAAPNDCSVCHQDGKDADLAYLRPVRDNCSSCHDDVVYDEPVPDGRRLHSGGIQMDDSSCRGCHPEASGIAGIRDSHFVDALDPDAPVLDLEIAEARGTAGGPATVRIRVTVDGMPRDILAEPLPTLRALIAGPNTDWVEFSQSTVQGGGASGTLTPIDATDGVFEYTFPPSNALPAYAEGSWTVGLEGYLQSGSARLGAFSVVQAFSVDGSDVAPRRQIVSSDRCNACHVDLNFHGGQRKNPDYCATCHNPNEVNDGRASRVETSTLAIPSVQLARMVHKIHAGRSLSQQPSLLYGFPGPSVDNPVGAPHDFGTVRYPAPLSDCTLCHEGPTYALPLGSSVQPVREQVRTCIEDPDADANDFCDDPFWVVTQTTEIPPQTAACMSCHDSPDAAAHAELNTTPSGDESCAACHGPGRSVDVADAHGLAQ